MLLQLDNLAAKATHGWQALNNASFDVSSEECVAVIGPNGSGKSSLLKAITGEYQSTAGSLLIDGQPVHSLNPTDKAKLIAVVAQNDHVDHRLTVKEYVSLGRVPHTFSYSEKEHNQIVAAAIADVDLTAKISRNMGSLSGGEQQRAHIARAFAQQPKLLLLDEPTNHLDPLARIEILELIKSKKIASIAVLHDLPLVSPFADKVVLMSDRTMIRCGTPQEVLNDQYITPIFGLSVLTFDHPKQGASIHHFEAAS